MSKRGMMYGAALVAGVVWGWVFTPWFLQEFLNAPSLQDDLLLAQHGWMIGPLLGGAFAGWFSNWEHHWWHGIVAAVLGVMLGIVAIHLLTPPEARLSFLVLTGIIDLADTRYAYAVLAVSAVLGLIGGLVGSKVGQRTT